MIEEHQVIPLLLTACPGFDSTWQEHLAWWNGHQRGPYNDAAEFARYLVESYDRGDTAEFPAAFATIESILNQGDEESRGVVTVGVLEGIQTIASHSCGADVFVQWLAPTSHAAWAEIERVWSGKHSLMDVIRAERRASK